MLVIVWEYLARPGQHEEFERVYGPEGEWARFFARGVGYLGTELLSDVNEKGRYLTIDRWVSREAFDAFQSRWGGEYREIDQRYEALTIREVALGSFAG